MSARQRELRLAVIKHRRGPGCRAVTDGTILGKSRLSMVWIRRSVEVLKMTADTCDRRPGKSTAGMTLRAIQPGMSARQRKTCKRGMVKSLGSPAIKAVTDLTLRRKSRCHVIDRFGVLEIIDMTECAVGIESAEQAHRSAPVAALAFNRGMGAKKRKPVFVRIDIFHNLAPSANAMALLAVAPQLTAMNIRVAIGTLGSNA